MIDSDEEDLYEGNESYDDEECGDIFTNLMRAAIDRVGHLRIFPEFRIFFLPSWKKKPEHGKLTIFLSEKNWRYNPTLLQTCH